MADAIKMITVIKIESKLEKFFTGDIKKKVSQIAKDKINASLLPFFTNKIGAAAPVGKSPKRGALSRSFVTEARRGPGGFSVGLRITSSVPYARAVIFGRDPLTIVPKLKGGRLSFIGTGEGRAGQTVVVGIVHQDSIKPNDFITPVYERDIQPRIDSIISESIDEVLTGR